MKFLRVSKFGVLASLLSFSALAAASGQLASRPDSPPTTRAESHAVDGSFLRDQVVLKVTPSGGSTFRVSLRPGENIYLTKSLRAGTEKRMAFVVMPEPEDRDLTTITRNEVMGRLKEDMTFYIMPICFNSPSVPYPPVGQRKTPADCQPRSAAETGGDHVVPFRDIKNENIRFGQEVYDEILDAHFTILSYRFSDEPNFQVTNPFSKCCLQAESWKVCSCAVSVGGEKCEAGCSLR